MVNRKDQAVTFFRKTLNYVDPIRLLPALVSHNTEDDKITVFGDTFTLSGNRPIYIIGTGKASAGMAEAMEKIFGEAIADGMVISSDNPLHTPGKTTVLTGSHPLPDERSIDATGQLLRFTEQIPGGAMVFNLVSGGTSSLFCKPPGGISTEDLQNTFSLLLNSGAGIDEINLVRKAVSDIKGGRFLQALDHTELIDLVISDVPNDNIADIGSGPTVAQAISFTGAIKILKNRHLWSDLPVPVRRFLTDHVKQTENGEINTVDIANHRSYIVSSSSFVAQKAAEIIQKAGYETILDHEPWSGSIKRFVEHIISNAVPFIEQERSPVALIFYGECSVDVSGSGKGGRNQELALRMARNLDRFDRELIFLSAGTDGIDGPTDAAGATVDQNSKKEAARMGLDIQNFLKHNDSYTFFDRFGGHIKTGPTGNNVMDLQFLLIP